MNRQERLHDLEQPLVRNGSGHIVYRGRLLPDESSENWLLQCIQIPNTLYSQSS
jgi:hypothetical protein